MNIRLATVADMPQMIPLVNAAFSVEQFIDGTRTDIERMPPMFDTGDFLVAEEVAEEVAEDGGHRILASVYTEVRHGAQGDAPRGYFGMLAVDPTQQGRGLGRLMVEAAEDHCRSQGCDVMDILVVNLRTELPPLYRKLGYIEVGEEEFRPSRPVKQGIEAHCIVMSKPL